MSKLYTTWSRWEATLALFWYWLFTIITWVYLCRIIFVISLLLICLVNSHCWPVLEPRWASVNRGVLICDECCSIHRGLGRHSSQVRHLTHSLWPPSQLQVRMQTEPLQMSHIQRLREPWDTVTKTQVNIRWPWSVLMLLYFFLYCLDGPGALWQRSKFHMGTQSSGPFLFDEWEAQSKSPGQSSVRVFLGFPHVTFDVC